MLKRVLPLVFAFLVTVISLVTYSILFFTGLLARFYIEAHLVFAIALVGTCIYLFRRERGLPALFMLIGSIGFTGASLHDCFIDWGLRFEWFQSSGTDGLVFRGFFEPAENPLLAIPADILRYASLLTYVGIFWLAARLAQRHLTNRCSQPLAAPAPRSNL